MEESLKVKKKEILRDLKEIAQTNKEILELLDKVEGVEKEEGKDKCLNDAAANDKLQQDTAKKDDLQSDIGLAPEKEKKHYPDKELSRQTSSDVIPTKVDDDVQDRHIKHIVTPKSVDGVEDLEMVKQMGSSVQDKQGFFERMILSERQKAFGKCVKSRKTVMEQDNRICDSFKLPLINKGHVYSWQRDVGTQESDNEVTTKQAEPMVQKKESEFEAKKGRSRGSISPVAEKKKLRQDDRKVETSAQSRPLKSILKKPSVPKPTPDKRKVVPKTNDSSGHKDHLPAVTSNPVPVSRPFQQGDGRDASKNKNVQQNLSQVMQVFDPTTQEGKQLAKAQAQHLRSLSQVLPGNRVALLALADIMDKLALADGSIEYLELLRNISQSLSQTQRTAINQYLEEMQGIMDSIGIDENIKILFQGSSSIFKAIVDGDFDDKAMAIAEHVESLKDETTREFDVMRLLSEQSRPNTQAIKTSNQTNEVNEETDTVKEESQHNEIIEAGLLDVQEAGELNQAEKGMEGREVNEEERVIINEGLWSEYASEEVKKGQIAKDIREKGMDTIFCLDLSMSMKGEALRQAKAFIRGFVEGIQNSKLGGDVYEHVALVTFGSETKVQQHLTCDYFEVLQKLETLRPGGPTPLFAGLTMTLAAILGAGTVFTSNGYKMHPRVYLLSDGKMTPSSFITGPDTCTEEEAKIERVKVVNHSEHLHKDYHLTINAVPVGEFDMGLLESITKQTDGKIISSENWKEESRTFQNYLKACSTGQSQQLYKVMVEVTNVSEDDQAQMSEFLQTHKREDDHGQSVTDDDDKDNIRQEFDRYHPLGTRVKQKGNTSRLFGTVTKHFKDGVGVTWDRVNEDGILRVKIVRLDELERVNEPRILKDELIAEGCRVKRGKDWHYGDQDGKAGNQGSVFLVLGNGHVLVRWDFDGSKGIYKFGAEGKFDLEVVQPLSKNSKNPTVRKDTVKNQGSQPSSGVVSPGTEVLWRWLDTDGSWKMYPPNVNKTIEAGYRRNPCGTVLITMHNKQFKVMFSRTEQIDINSGEKYPISRDHV